MPRSSPYVNLIVIRSPDIDRAISFYEKIGMEFVKHAHGSGPEHYASEQEDFVFEVYPLKPDASGTTAVRLGFTVTKIDTLVADLANLGAKVVSSPRDSEWGRRSVVKDLDGHTVELLQS